MPIELRFLIDVLIVLLILGWGTVYSFLQTYTEYLKKLLEKE